MMKSNKMLGKSELTTLMDETFPARRKAVLAGMLTVKKLKMDFPLLFEAKEVRSAEQLTESTFARGSQRCSYMPMTVVLSRNVYPVLFKSVAFHQSELLARLDKNWYIKYGTFWLFFETLEGSVSTAFVV